MASSGSHPSVDRVDDGLGATEAAEADVAEQQRDLREEDLDPLAPADTAVPAPSPDALDVGAGSEADLADQAVEVDLDDDEDRG